MDDIRKNQFSLESRADFEQLLYKIYGERRVILKIQEQRIALSGLCFVAVGPGGEERRRGRRFLYYTLGLAIHGR